MLNVCGIEYTRLESAAQRQHKPTYRRRATNANKTRSSQASSSAKRARCVSRKIYTDCRVEGCLSRPISVHGCNSSHWLHGGGASPNAIGQFDTDSIDRQWTDDIRGGFPVYNNIQTDVCAGPNAEHMLNYRQKGLWKT